MNSIGLNPPSSPVECSWFDVLATVLDSGWITDRKAPGRIGFIHHWTITYNESIQNLSEYPVR